MRDSDKTFKPGDPIPADWLNAIAENVVKRISVVGGRFAKSGSSLTLTIDNARKSSNGFIAKIVTAGPSSESDYSDARYWIKEQSATFSSHTITLADKTNGLWVTATNIGELGLGSSGVGIHGCLFKTGESVARATAPTRYVRAYSVGASEYVFDTPPFVYIASSYYLDVLGLDDDDCVDSSMWWKGVIPFAVTDYDAAPP